MSKYSMDWYGQYGLISTVWIGKYSIETVSGSSSKWLSRCIVLALLTSFNITFLTNILP